METVSKPPIILCGQLCVRCDARFHTFSALRGRERAKHPQIFSCGVEQHPVSANLEQQLEEMAEYELRHRANIKTIARDLGLTKSQVRSRRRLPVDKIMVYLTKNSRQTPPPPKIGDPVIDMVNESEVINASSELPITTEAAVTSYNHVSSEHPITTEVFPIGAPANIVVEELGVVESHISLPISTEVTSIPIPKENISDGLERVSTSIQFLGQNKSSSPHSRFFTVGCSAGDAYSN